MAQAKHSLETQTLTLQLTLDRAAETIDWYKKALGAEEVTRNTGPDGKIMHANLKIGNTHFIVNDVMPGSKGPQAYGGSPTSMWLYVDDCDALFKRATGAGAKVHMPLEDQFWGDRAGAVADPAGYMWWIASHKETLTKEEIDERAAAFFKQHAPTAGR